MSDGGTTGRHDWIDAGRGLAIVLVVLVHARDWLQGIGLDLDGWSQVNDVAAGLRMPLFFAVSGLLGARWLAGDWRRLLSDKLTFLWWVYLAWQPLGLAAAALADRFTGGDAAPLHLVLALGATVVRPRSELWFLWALAVYFVLLRAGARVPLRPQVVLAAVVAAVGFSDWVPEGNLGWSGVPKFYLFFLLGARCRPAFLRLAERLRQGTARSGVVVWTGVVGWAGLAALAVLTHLDAVPGVGLAVRLLGLVSGTALATRLTGSRLLRHLGSRTLPIYLAHTPLIVVLVWGAYRLRVTGWPTGVRLVLPVLVAASAVALSLALHAMLCRTAPGRLLYAPPVALVARLRGRHAPRHRAPGRAGRRPSPVPARGAPGRDARITGGTWQYWLDADGEHRDGRVAAPHG